KTARRALYAGLTALADALAVHAPPERPITFDWPDGVRVNGGLVGGARLAWPPRADENEPPAWLGVAALIRTVALGDEEPGLRRLCAAREEEGFADLGSGRLVESFARHLMVALDAWQEQGFGEVAKNYLARLAPESGVRRDIAENGDLLMRRITGRGEAEQRSLLRALGEPSWLDPATGGPRKGDFCAPSASTRRTRSCSSAPPIRANGRCRAPSCSRTPTRMRLRANHARPFAAGSWA